ncbi:MAG: ATP-binding cassette domain-containing protein [Elusimicrobiota bacterium]|jgi:zinc transport system ATP-binding protein|nr:ATP-binding cassette domain-containing protein [Elusimicrobiota bacterium]
MALISVKDVSFEYDGNIVLNELNFRLFKGDYLCVIGENGSGKTTLIKGLLKLKQQYKGDIVFGDDLKSDEIGYLPQKTFVQKDFPASVFEVVLSGRLNNLKLKPFYTKKDKIIVEENLNLFGISNLKNKSYRELSGGEQQRVLLSRALCSTKKLLLLDEPATGLDPLATADLYKIIKKINKEKGITIIIVSHDIQNSLKYASHILHLENKQIFFGVVKDYVVSDIKHRFFKGDS